MSLGRSACSVPIKFVKGRIAEDKVTEQKTQIYFKKSQTTLDYLQSKGFGNRLSNDFHSIIWRIFLETELEPTQECLILSSKHVKRKHGFAKERDSMSSTNL